MLNANKINSAIKSIDVKQYRKSKTQENAFPTKYTLTWVFKSRSLGCCANNTQILNTEKQSISQPPIKEIGGCNITKGKDGYIRIKGSVHQQVIIILLFYDRVSISSSGWAQTLSNPLASRSWVLEPYRCVLLGLSKNNDLHLHALINRSPKYMKQKVVDLNTCGRNRNLQV